MLSEINYEDLGIRIKAIRKERGLTQEALAEMVGCNTSHISNIENNYTKLSLNVLVAIANALEVSVDYLLANQIDERNSALSHEMLKRFEKCSDSDKEKVLQIINIFID